MDKTSLKLLPVILKYPKFFFGGGGGCIRKSSHNLWNCPFNSHWLTSVCTQNHILLFALVLSRRAHKATDSTKSILTQHTLHQIVRKMWERSVSFTVPAYGREIVGGHGCSTAAVKNRPCVLALEVDIVISCKSWSNCVDKQTVSLMKRD